MSETDVVVFLLLGRRRDGGDVDQLRVRPVGEPVDDGEVDLALVAPELLELVGRDARVGSDSVIGRTSRPGRSRGSRAFFAIPFVVV